MTTETEKLRKTVCIDVEAMLTACVPGGSIADPQTIADAIRAWVAEQPAAQEAERPFVDIPKLRMALSQLGIAAPESSEQLSAQASNYIDDVLDAVIAYGRISEPAAVPDGMCLVTKEDGNNYCRILAMLGMEEDGDPVAAIEAMLAAAQEPNYPEIPDSSGSSAEPAAVPAAEFVEALRKGFMTSESCGPDKHFQLIVKFQSLADLQSAHNAFTLLAAKVEG